MDKETALAQWAALREVELFLFREAQLADGHRYKEWFALWTEELLYWVPCNSDEPAIGRKIALINDNRPQLDERIYRLGTKFAHAQNPKSRLTRVIGNVVLEQWDAARGGRVSSSFHLTEVRNNRQRKAACACARSTCSWSTTTSRCRTSPSSSDTQEQP